MVQKSDNKMMQFKYNDGSVAYSVVMPVYNQESIIVKNLQGIINNTFDNFEIILILDYCYDDTEKHILDYLSKYQNKKDNLIQIKIFKNTEKPLFETKCDNIGFKNSQGRYCLEIQSDMEMTEPGYNLHLTKPFLLLENVIAVSGRCAHNLFSPGGVGKLGRSIEEPLNHLNISKNKFYVFETCNRGPLLLDKKKLQELNYLDEDNYFLENCDHDLMARAYISKGYICGYVPIEFNAPLNDGTRRKNKVHDNSTEGIINQNEKLKRAQECSKGKGLKKYKLLWKAREPVIYDI